MAKIENAPDLTVITGIPGLGSIESVPLTAGIGDPAAIALRSIPEARVTLYDFIPLVGLCRETDPSGRTVSYEYDDYGRLTTVKGPENEILSEYYYSMPR